jgi:thiol-disulfide isomerase/thioredoxin
MRPDPDLSTCLASCLAAGLMLVAAGCSRGPGPAATPPRDAAVAPADRLERNSNSPVGAVNPGAERDGTPKPTVPPQPLVVPPLPDGTPEELLAFVTNLQTTKVEPQSREELLGYVQGICSRGIEAAERILATVPANDPNGLKASRLKLESLMMLSDLDEGGKPSRDLAAYAQALADGPTPALARLGKRTLIMLAAQKAFAANDMAAVAAAVPDLVTRMADVLAADPDDTESAKLAGSLGRAAEQIEIPGQAAPAIAAYETFARTLEKSSVPGIQKVAASMAGTARRLGLPGKPMELAGTRLDGTAFDAASLAGKVVLVDFWATWCGPCLQEIPNILAQYEKYHAQGFEVLAISLDESREDLDAFLAGRKLPWPILFSGKGWEDPLARSYGISGIPQLILVGRDGNVISTTARGERLGELLAGLFPADDGAAAPAATQPDAAP